MSKAKPPSRKTFDERERERLRSALLSYMKQHRIGVPTLQVRIAEAADRSPDLIPLKTLQRFLAGAGRTHDGFLIPCSQFAESLPPPDDPAELARELSEFFGPAVKQTPAQSGLHQAAAERLAGRYAVATDAYSSPLTAAEEEDGNRRAEYSRCVFQSYAPNGALRMTEQVFNPKRLASVSGRTAASTHSFQGLALIQGTLIFVLSKETLTGLPRIYWLTELAEGALAGFGAEARLPSDDVLEIAQSMHFTFQRLTEGEPS